MGIIYLASPCSHPDADVREERFQAVCREAAKIMESGQMVFSPMAHGHPIALYGDLPSDWEYWAKYDRKLIEFCSELWVLMIDGWKESKGVINEIKIAMDLGKRVWYHMPGERRPVCYIHPKHLV